MATPAISNWLTGLRQNFSRPWAEDVLKGLGREAWIPQLDSVYANTPSPSGREAYGPTGSLYPGAPGSKLADFIPGGANTQSGDMGLGPGLAAGGTAFGGAIGGGTGAALGAMAGGALGGLMDGNKLGPWPNSINNSLLPLRSEYLSRVGSGFDADTAKRLAFQGVGLNPTQLNNFRSLDDPRAQEMIGGNIDARALNFLLGDIPDLEPVSPPPTSPTQAAPEGPLLSETLAARREEQAPPPNPYSLMTPLGGSTSGSMGPSALPSLPSVSMGMPGAGGTSASGGYRPSYANIDDVLGPIQNEIQRQRAESLQAMTDFQSRRQAARGQYEQGLQQAAQGALQTRVPEIENRLGQLGILQSGAYPAMLAKAQQDIFNTSILPQLSMYDLQTINQMDQFPMQQMGAEQGLRVGGLQRQFGMEDMLAQNAFQQGLAGDAAKKQEMAALLGTLPSLVGMFGGGAGGFGMGGLPMMAGMGGMGGMGGAGGMFTNIGGQAGYLTRGGQFVPGVTGVAGPGSIPWYQSAMSGAGGLSGALGGAAGAGLGGMLGQTLFTDLFKDKNAAAGLGSGLMALLMGGGLGGALLGGLGSGLLGPGGGMLGGFAGGLPSLDFGSMFGG